MSKKPYGQTTREAFTEIFFMDMELLGFDKAAAEAELDRLEGCEEEIDYIKTSRVGATVRLNRAQRKHVFKIFDTWMA